jgi:mannosylglycerate hydrolase
MSTMFDMTPDRAGALDDEARRILRLNDRGGYTVPTAGLYPYQWNWDSAFAALGFAGFDVDRAWTELETLMAGQWENGMLPHIQFHAEDTGYFPGADVWGTENAVGKGPGRVASSGISQPPVVASFALSTYRKDKAAGQDRLRALYPRLMALHRWFMTHRAESGAVAITHPWEAGRDNAPDWDDAMAGFEPAGIAPYTRRDTGHVDPRMRPTKSDYDRYIWLVQFARDRKWDDAAIAAESPFRVADPTMTFTLMRGSRDLVEIARALGEPTTEIEAWIARLETGAETLWNAETACYDSRNLRTGKLNSCVTNASFLSWWGGLRKGQPIDTLRRVLAAASYTVPSFDPAHPKFDSLRYWRGPVWGIMNMMISTGLREAGLLDEAERIRRDTAELISDKGFAEYFDPQDGTPAGGGTFTWTAAIWLGWASPNAKEL